MALRIKTATSTRAGSCNCCEEHCTAAGMVEHAVAILTVGYGGHTTSLRFCEKCFAGLKTLVSVVDPPKIDRRLSCPICATVVEDRKGRPSPAECEWCKKTHPAWRSVHHPRFGQKGD